MAATTLDTISPAGPTAASGAAVLEPLDDQGASMALAEIVRESFDSLLANKMRSLLTMLGVIIGVASVVALLAIGNGASDAITGQVKSIGTNMLTVLPGSQNRTRPGTTTAQSLTLADAEAIAALKLPVSGIAPQFSSSADIVARAADKTTSVIGTTPEFLSLNNLVLSSGQFFNEGQVRSAEAVIVLGSNLANTLFGTGQAVGQTVRIKGQSLRVIGVLATKGGSAFGSVDDWGFIPISVAQTRLFGGRTPDGNGYLVSNISLSANDSQELTAIQGRITLLLRERHHLKADGSEDDFTVFNQASLLSTLSTITNLLTVFLSAIAGISLLVGGIGIMNIMLVSVTERTREIGLRKAVGARERDILVQFIVEALVISLTGGVIGLLLGGALALVVTLTGVLTAVLPLSAVLLALGFSLAVGLFFGIYPAQRAAKLNPIDALRYE